MDGVCNIPWEKFLSTSTSSSKKALKMVQTIIHLPIQPAVQLLSSGMPLTPIKGKYTVNGTIRYEGTNRLGKSRTARWLPTWNISGAYNVHEEVFWESLRNSISHLSLKASYSLTGDPGPSSVSNSLIEINSYKPYRPGTNIQESGLQILNLANDELTYEKKHELNIGMEVGFFR